MSAITMRYGDTAEGKGTGGGGEGSGAGITNITNASASVTTLPAGSSATVSTTLSESSLHFQFGIPTSITDYAQLTNKPQIEGVTLEGNKTYSELNLEAISGETITNIFRV